MVCKAKRRKTEAITFTGKEGTERVHPPLPWLKKGPSGVANKLETTVFKGFRSKDVPPDPLGFEFLHAYISWETSQYKIAARITKFREFKDVVFEDVVFDDSRFDIDVAITNNR